MKTVAFWGIVLIDAPFSTYLPPPGITMGIATAAAPTTASSASTTPTTIPTLLDPPPPLPAGGLAGEGFCTGVFVGALVGVVGVVGVGFEGSVGVELGGVAGFNCVGLVGVVLDGFALGGTFCVVVVAGDAAPIF